MKYTTHLDLCVAGSLVLAGCGAEPGNDGEAELLGSEESTLVTANAIVPNAIVPNAIVPNALFPGAIVSSALALGALDSASHASIVDPGEGGRLSRLFLKYTVGCALSPSQSFSFSWTDTGSVVHNETYVGSLGLQPSWATQPLTDTTKQRLISACLAARTNYLGVPVLISLRSPLDPLDSVPADELAAYPRIEGAFWGNLFTESPHLYSCHRAANLETSRAAGRYCATGYVDADGQVLPCGPITLTGVCESVCSNLNGPGSAYTSCASPSAGSTATDIVITSALP